MLKRKQPEVFSKLLDTPQEIRWRDRNNISDLLLCTICQDVFTIPMRISCGHSFCKACVESWFKSSARRDCPTCRSTIRHEATHRDLLAQAFLEREDVFCNGRCCNWMGPLGELARHQAVCINDEPAMRGKVETVEIKQRKQQLINLEIEIDKELKKHISS